MNQAGAFTKDLQERFKKSYADNKKMLAMTNAMSRSDLTDLAYHTEGAASMRQKFSVNIQTMTVTNQKSSGRCWLFAALNVLREKIGKEHNIEFVELSQSYAAFYDKFERANYFLESILDTADREIEDRTVTYLLQTCVHDGGQWDMFLNLVEKYGVCPKEAMPETFQSSNTGRMSQLLNERLRAGAVALREHFAAGDSMESLQEMKNSILEEVYTFLVACYGQPPETFDFEYVDKDKNYHVDRNLTPASFMEKYIGDLLKNTASIINAPTKDKPFDRTYTVAYLGNTVEGAPVCYLNLTMKELKEAVIAQLKDGQVVWFGSDVGKFGTKEGGIWDDSSLDYQLLTDMNLELTKEQRLDYRDSAMNHAMVITGVNLVDDKPTRWRIQNSWGDERGEKGYYMCSDSWFEQFVYQAVVDKKYLGDKAKLLSQEPIVLTPWDPMGSLA